MQLVSDCCGATPWLNNEDMGLCGDCKEHCEFIDLDDQVSDKQKKKQLASLLYTTCRMGSDGDLTRARAKMKERGMQHHDIEEIVGIMMGIHIRNLLTLGR